MPTTVLVSTHRHSLPLGPDDDVHAAFKLHRKRELGMGDLPGVAELEPLVRLLHLVAVHDSLVEDAEVIAQAVPDGGEAQRGHGVEKTGGQAAETTIAQPGVHFAVAKRLPIQPELGHRGAATVFQLEVDDVVPEQAADQELERQIVDPLDVLPVMRLLGGDPALDQAVAHRQRQREITVAVGGGVAVLRQGPPQVALELAPQTVNGHARCDGGGQGIGRQVSNRFGRCNQHGRGIGGNAGNCSAENDDGLGIPLVNC